MRNLPKNSKKRVTFGFFIIRYKHLLAAIMALTLACVCLLTLFAEKLQTPSAPLTDFVIVIDAGHGGIDGGVCGVKSGVKESVLNLKYAKLLKKALENSGFKVIMTRETENGLYGTTQKGFKRRDMEKRAEIIASGKPNVVISVHMNKYSCSSRSGPQVFFQEKDEASHTLAKYLQNALNAFSGNKHSALKGDYYICRTSKCPAVIVEYGFLSNPAEELNLLDDSYANVITQAVASGLMSYLCGLN